MPLDVGNTWHYIQRIHEPGAPITPLSRTILEHRDIAFGDRTVTVAVEVPVPDEAQKWGWTRGRLLRNEADGLYYYGSMDGENLDLLSEPRRLAPLNGRAGETYGSLVCVAADSLVSTEFGEVVADVYVFSMNEGTFLIPDIYVVPGVGMNFYSYNTEYSIWMVGYDFE